MKQIADYLSNDTGGVALSDAEKGNRVYQAWELLFKAKDFPEDAGASEVLANQVFNAWRVRDEVANNNKAYQNLEATAEDQQHQIGTDDRNVYQTILSTQQEHNTLSSDGSPGQAPAYSGSSPSGSSAATAPNTQGNRSAAPGGVSNLIGNAATSGQSLAVASSSANGSNVGNGGNSTSGSSPAPQLPTPNISAIASQLNANTFAGMNGSGPQVTKGTFDAYALARTYAKQSLLDADTATLAAHVKLEYQTQVLTFIMQRRFQHSLLAGEFYEHIFKGSAQDMQVAQQQISSFINTDHIMPSVTSIEFVSHEAMAEVDSGMKAVENAYDAGERWTAVQQLLQTFLLGENMPSVQEFDPAKRKVLLKIYRAGNDLKHLLDMRDFAGAEDAIQSIQSDATDFDAAPILSAIKQGKQLSNNLVMSAEQAALVNDPDKVSEYLQKATEIWPLNPEITSFSKSLRDRTNLANVGSLKFKDLLARGDDRAIYEARDEIGLAVYSDPTLSAQFKKIVNNEMQVDMAVAMANQAMKQNNGYAAWEVLMTASDLEPNDPVLNRMEKDVATHVAPYVAALDAASRAEKAGEYAASFNYYLQAQDIYPASQICHDAIEDLSLRIMAKANPNGNSAKALTKQEAEKAMTPPAPATPAS